MLCVGVYRCDECVLSTLFFVKVSDSPCRRKHLTNNLNYYHFSRVCLQWLLFWFSRMNTYANVKVVVMLTEWCSSIEYRVVHPEHVVRWRLHIACKGLSGILQKHYANCILITRDYSQLYLRFSATCLERNSWYVLLCGGLFKITMPLKALILPLKARLIILHVNPVRQRHFFVVFRRLVKNETTRKSVYIIPKGWTRTTECAKASILFPKSGPRINAEN